MFKLGVTGGIGSGKSTVCRLFEVLGVPVYYSDPRAKQLMTSDAIIIREMKSEFGEAVYLSTGELDKNALSGIVFNDSKARDKVNAIVHPAVVRDFVAWTSTVAPPCGYVVFESALLFESHISGSVDEILTVTCPDPERVKRVVKRDGCSEEDALRKLGSQMPQDEKARWSNHVVPCSVKSMIIDEILRIHGNIVENCKKK